MSVPDRLGAARRGFSHITAALLASAKFTSAKLSSAALIGAALAGAAISASPARAETHHTTHHHHHYHHRVSHHHYHHRVLHHTVAHHAWHSHAAASHHHRHVHHARYRHSRLQCVPYAREISHIGIIGDAFLWWAKAAGRYARGHTPVVGAVLNFRPIHRMPLGHVAVVTAVLDSRTILVTQANWLPGTITNDVTVQDVSPKNDWTKVEVELGNSTKWGSPYPTYGFIYNRPNNGTVIARNGQGTEVAEAPAVKPVSNEAPNRNLQ